MANSFFQFKQFRIDQGNCGMKVTTEGCIFGALPTFSNGLKPNKVLDIGTGTGLLALMKAQQTEAQIDAIEIDEIAYEQAKANFENSSWANRLSVFHVDLLEFKPNLYYDQIICNPPFFQDNQLGTNSRKNKAIHNSNLSFDDLAAGISRLLTPETGVASVLYPEHEMNVFSQKMKQKGFNVVADIQVYNQIGKPTFRRIKSFSQMKTESKVPKTFIIKEQDGAYTKQFVHLLKDYYLHL